MINVFGHGQTSGPSRLVHGSFYFVDILLRHVKDLCRTKASFRLLDGILVLSVVSVDTNRSDYQ